jgi:negative regulator of sigma E activity
MNQRRTLQQQVPTPIVVTQAPRGPFEENSPIFSLATAELLNDTIPPMGVSQPASIAPPSPPVNVEEQYEYTERRAFTTSTTPQYYDLQTANPKEILLIAETDDHFVEFNRQIDGDSPKIFASGSLSLTGKAISRVWFQAANSAGKLYIIVFKR